MYALEMLTLPHLYAGILTTANNFVLDKSPFLPQSRLIIGTVSLTQEMSVINDSFYDAPAYPIISSRKMGTSVSLGVIGLFGLGAFLRESNLEDYPSSTLLYRLHRGFQNDFSNFRDPIDPIARDVKKKLLKLSPFSMELLDKEGPLAKRFPF